MSLVTISSMAALDGAQTRIFLKLRWVELSIEMMPLMVWVFPVPAIIFCKRVVRKIIIILTRSLDEEEIDWFHGRDIYQSLVLALVEFGLVLFYELAHQLSAPIGGWGQFRGRVLLLNQGRLRGLPALACLERLGLLPFRDELRV